MQPERQLQTEGSVAFHEFASQFHDGGNKIATLSGHAAGLNRVREEGIKKIGRPTIGRKTEDAIRHELGAGHGILKVAKLVGVDSSTVQRVKREMAAAA